MSTSTADQYRDVSIESIQPNPVALRSVDRSNEQYQNLSRDVGRRGVLQPILVREKEDEATGEKFYELCDGLQRYSACIDNGVKTVTVKVQSLSDAEVEETQLVANLCRVDTTPIEYTNQLRRMMQRNPTMTEADLAEMISQSPSFVRQRLGLLKLDDSIQALVDDGSIKLANAYALAKLPREEQHNWTDQAMTQPPSEFVSAVQDRAKELAAAAREGRKAEPPSFKPKPKLKKQAVLEAEFENPEVGPSLVAEHDVTSAEDGFALGIAFALSLDPGSVEEQKAKWEKTQAEREDAKIKRQAAREERRRREAAEKAAEAREKSGLDDAELEKLIAEQEAEEAKRREAKEAAKAAEDAEKETAEA